MNVWHWKIIGNDFQCNTNNIFGYIRCLKTHHKYNRIAIIIKEIRLAVKKVKPNLLWYIFSTSFGVWCFPKNLKCSSQAPSCVQQSAVLGYFNDWELWTSIFNYIQCVLDLKTSLKLGPTMTIWITYGSEMKFKIWPSVLYLFFVDFHIYIWFWKKYSRGKMKADLK